jgi:hypothetical protein
MTQVLTAGAPVTDAVFALLQDPTLQTAVAGRIFDDIPEGTPRPIVLIETLVEIDRRGLGTGNLPEIDLRTHVFSDLGSMSEAKAINQMLVALLKDAAINIVGFAQAGLIVWHQTIALPNQILNGILVHEVVSTYTVWCEQV